MADDHNFHISVFGHIDSVYFPGGLIGDSVFMRYEFVAGESWEIISGCETGISQTSSPGSKMEFIAFNVPIEVTFRSSTPSGWPQLILSVYGINIWGIENILGYGRVHVPVNPSSRSTIEVDLSVPRWNNRCPSFPCYVSFKNREIGDPKILADGRIDSQLQTISYGTVKLELQLATRGLSSMHLDCA